MPTTLEILRNILLYKRLNTFLLIVYFLTSLALIALPIICYVVWPEAFYLPYWISICLGIILLAWLGRNTFNRLSAYRNAGCLDNKPPF